MANRKCFLLLILVVAACAREQPTQTRWPAYTTDAHSYARPQEARVSHVSLDLLIDFAERRISGTATLKIERAPGADKIVVDISDLSIDHITDGEGNALPFEVGPGKPFMGQPLTIALPGNTSTVAIEYGTSPQATGVQWLMPPQTAGKKLPFLFTQGESILTRSWVPTQDSPGIRQTYDAVIHAPAGMRAVMSAERVNVPGKDAQGRNLFRFRMDKPIPPYLFALAVGDLSFRPIGAASGVYAEPPVLELATHDFAEVEEMIAAAERLYGPYRWGRYDVLVLPPSFPWGGMENPRLTFISPTVLTGDQSLAGILAHELAHSWSGNLVTNATWDDFWLNEGFTTYIETRIMEELRGKRFADMLRQIGRQDWERAIADAGGRRSPDSRLHLDLAGRDPDQVTSDVAYQKGSAFLETVESVVGRQRLDAFLREYFDTFAFQAMTSERMLAYMREKLFRDDDEVKVNVREWVYEPGVPNNVPTVRSEAFADIDRHVAVWNKGGTAAAIPVKSWGTLEWQHFLRGLPHIIRSTRLAELDRAFGLSESRNSEILFAWLQIAIRNRYEPAFPALERFLTSQGRRRFVAPLYQDLAKTPWGKPMAAQIYRQARPTYHSVSIAAIDQILR